MYLNMQNKKGVQTAEAFTKVGNTKRQIKWNND